VTTQQPPGVGGLLERFRAFQYSVFRLETLQHYAGSGEDEGIAAFWRGDPEPPPDPAEDEYAGMVRAHRAAGKTRQRVHVVHEPLSDYLVYELTWEYGPHVAAGEDIRIIDATQGWPDDVPFEDFWLFDSRYRFDLRYAADGTWLGVEPVTDPTCLADACAVRDAAWHQSIPWADYIARYPELVRRLPTMA
jgi:hypothetical protein